MNKLKRWCWRCGWNTNEYINIRVLIERRGKCFYCRIDALDMKYGPSESAETYKRLSKKKQYKRPLPSKWSRISRRLSV